MFEIFQLQFMQYAFLAGIAIAIIAPAIGMFLVVRRYSLMADTLAHVSLTGVAIGVIAGLNPIGTAIAVSIIAALGIEYLRIKKNIAGESILSLFLSGGLAVAVILLSIANTLKSGVRIDIVSFLFGSITTVTSEDLWLIGISGAATLACLFFLFKEFFFVSLNEEVAAANGLPTTFLNLLLAALTAVTVSISMRTVGILLIGALMVIPVISATQYHQSFKKTIFVAGLFSLLSVIGGLFISYYVDLPSGGTIVACALVIFAGSALVNKGVHYS